MNKNVWSDIMNSILRNPAISSYLSYLPKAEWSERIEALILIGIKSLKGKEFSLSQLWSLTDEIYQYPSTLPQLESQLDRLKQDLAFSSGSMDKTSKFKNSLKRMKRPKRRSIQSKNTDRDLKGSSKSPKNRKIPRYLKDVNSKIKLDVRKDRMGYKKQNKSPPMPSINLSNVALLKTPQHNKQQFSAQFSPSMVDLLIDLDSHKKEGILGNEISSEVTRKSNDLDGETFGKESLVASPQKRKVADPSSFSPYIASIKKTSYSMVERTPPSYMYSDDI